MSVIYGMNDKEKDKINTLFDNVGIYTGGENKVFVALKGMGEFYIDYKEHGIKPSYVSGLPFAYQFFKSKGIELNFKDLINLELDERNNFFYEQIPQIAAYCLATLLQNENLNTVYLGLKGIKFYEKRGDVDSLFLYQSSKAFGNKKTEELKEIKEKLDDSLFKEGFSKGYEKIFGHPSYLASSHLSSNANARTIFIDKLFESIRNNNFRTVVTDYNFDKLSGHRGNEYIKCLQQLDKYKFKKEEK